MGYCIVSRMDVLKRVFPVLFALAVVALACTRSMTGEVELDEPSNDPIPTVVITIPPTITPIPSPTPTPNPSTRITTGDKALINGDWDLALAEYQNALQSSNDPLIQPAALLGLGRAYLYAGNTYQADAHLQRLIENYPNTPEAHQAYIFLGKTHEAGQNNIKAAEAYKNYLDNSTGSIDAYIWDMRGDMLFAAGDYGGAIESFLAAIETDSNGRATSTLDELYLNMKLARAYALSGDFPTALALYDDLYYRTNNHYTRALIDLRVGQIHTELGQTELAQEAYFDAVYNYPKSSDTHTALISLVEAGIEVHELNRGIVDYYAGEYGAATEAFNRYLQDAPTDPATAYYYYGLSKRALGSYQEANSWWDKIIADHGDHQLWDEAWEQKAYTQWAYEEGYEAGIQTLLGFAEAASAHPRAAEFVFDAATVSERMGDLVRAIELWKQVVNVYPDDERSPRALFLAAITHYRLQEYQEALSAFQRYIPLATSIGEHSAAQFWIGKSQAAVGDKEGALQSWEIAAGIDPTGYYSERARDVLHGKAEFTPPEQYDLTSDPISERQRAETWMRTTFSLPQDMDLSGLGELISDPNLIRGTALWELGFYDQARLEFEEIRQRVESDPVNTYRLANYLIAIGAYRSGIMAARGVLNLAGMDDAATLGAPIYFNHLRFGAYYNDMILPLADEYNFHPLLLYSVIRQESLFDASISSAADARGLMQVIPTTGAEIAANLGWPEDYTADDLFRPNVSLRFGVDYLDTQRRIFDGDLYAALAAYNGGPGNSRSWLELAPDDPDLFLEVIRLSETRNYIRGIYEIFSIYRYIYNRTP